MTIIIVDDNVRVRTALCDALRLYGFEVIGEASGGYEAVRLCHELQPEIVILDLRLPDMDGFETLHKIRENCESVKSILLTSSLDLPYAESKEAGFNAVLSKYDAGISKLIAVIDSLNLSDH
jgi:two-component system, NarL family, invasion response regulator UvrY